MGEKGAKVELLGDLRIRIRRWLGVSQFQKSHRDRITNLEVQMAISQADLERLNAATSRIAARVASLLDQIDALGTGNDDQVRAQAQQESILQASADLRPVIDQLEALGADASQPVPEPTPEQVPVEPGPDVAPVESGESSTGGGTVVTDPAPAPGAPAGDTSTTPDGDAAPVSPDGDATFDESGIAVGEPAPAPAAPVDPTGPTDGSVVGDGSGASQPGATGDEATPTDRT